MRGRVAPVAILHTSRAQCRDCYKCLRACPVKAIKVTNNHAQIWEEACVLDGACMAVCPQQAKQVQSDLEEVKELLRTGSAAAVVAPSYWAAYGVKRGSRLGGLLKQLGFQAAYSAANAAQSVAAMHFAFSSCHPMISSSCPAVVSLVEKHYPELLDWLVPVVSPMIGQARRIKEELGNATRVVFIGPCLAKKDEARRAEFGGDVDAVLSFQELDRWIEEDVYGWDDCPEEGICEASAAASCFPLEGGLGQAAGRTVSDGITVLSISGLEDCQKVLGDLASDKSKHSERLLLEMFACRGGCINGPLMPRGTTELSRRRNMVEALAMLRTQGTEKSCKAWWSGASEMLYRKFVPRPIRWIQPSPEELTQILAGTGKFSTADELNCGACGYNTCREKAAAVYNGVAEAQMCIPYMRARAESLANVILAAAPNGIIVTDLSLRILYINQAAQKMFRVGSDGLRGHSIAEILPTGDFLRALDSKKLIVTDGVYDEYGIAVRQYLVSVPEQEMLLGIFVDVADEVRRQQELAQLKEATLTRAQEVIDKQMRVAQEIAGLLGETTAETKVLLTKLIKLMQDDGKTN